MKGEAVRRSCEGRRSWEEKPGGEEELLKRRSWEGGETGREEKLVHQLC